MFTVEGISELVRGIRRENGFPDSPFRIDEVRYDEEEDKLFIIAHDRTDKSVVIGNSFVIGKLRERLGVKQVTVYSNLDLEIKREKLEKAERLVKGTELEFLLPIIEAEKRFPPRKWPDIRGDIKTLVFLSFSAKALLGFAERLNLPYEAVGIRYSFPRLKYEPIKAEPKELFFPDEGKLVALAEERGAKLVLADFPFGLKSEGGIYLLNPFRLLHIGFFELKYLFGSDMPTVYDKKALIRFVTSLTYEGLMESTDGANLIWRMWRK
ncbi:hypothetical protein [Thermococcus thioreducens]|uniref:Uncharacterized protein n=1 Tax=Thermococcus thioreducens TaxID=277988 RepID=A0A0Q2M5Z6_9EURY|nr:hypothetical protein [Thermococcus thioreducens]ASJ13255.1 hypothetical protein A3L14_10340 [Thermococcus thioreducens]KQH83330.1 hypothetical protein AMR53_01270 [Thermococcus thioreducens]SEW21625.1 hypothetical protein SAMN05216170_2170 [Thermococcus thioreducens]